MLLRTIRGASVDFTKEVATALHLPMFRHFTKPLHAGGFDADVGVEAAGDGAVDDGLLLLPQQLDQLLLGADVALDPPVSVIQEPNYGGLLGKGWEGQPH